MFEDGRMVEEVRQFGEDVAKLAAASLWPLTDDDLIDTLRVAYRLEQAAAALQARLVQQAVVRKLPARHGHRNTTGWLRSHLLLDPGPARALTDRATALAHHPELEQALLDGRVGTCQATVIAATSDTVAAELAELAEVAEPGASDPVTDGRVAHEATIILIELTDRLPPYQLRRVGERILAHVAPQVAERADELALARKEARAHRARAFTLSTQVAGIVRLSGVLGAEDAALVRAALDPLCAPVVNDERSPASGGPTPWPRCAGLQAQRTYRARGHREPIRRRQSQRYSGGGRSTSGTASQRSRSTAGVPKSSCLHSRSASWPPHPHHQPAPRPTCRMQ